MLESYSGSMNCPGWRKIFPWGVAVPKSPLFPFLGPLHLVAPRLGAATECYRWVHANNKFLQHHGSFSSQGVGLFPPPDFGPPTSHLQEQGIKARAHVISRAPNTTVITLAPFHRRQP